MLGTAVAKTIGNGMVDLKVVTMPTILCALIAAIVWNLLTWLLGLPSSSSHALIGGLCGAGVASADGDWSVLHWKTGLLPKVVIPMISSPIVGFLIGGLLMFILLVTLRRFTPHVVQSIFGKLQLVSAAWMGLSHGTNDAQKTMGIIALALFTGTTERRLRGSAAVAEFPPHAGVQGAGLGDVPLRADHGGGTAAGGWRIIRTLGHKMVKLQPVHGFAAETTAAVDHPVASSYGIPLSTTHVISTSIMGVGAIKRFSAVKWGRGTNRLGLGADAAGHRHDQLSLARAARRLRSAARPENPQPRDDENRPSRPPVVIGEQMFAFKDEPSSNTS